MERRRGGRAGARVAHGSSRPGRPRDQARPPRRADLPRAALRSGPARLRRRPSAGRTRAGGAGSTRRAGSARGRDRHRVRQGEAAHRRLGNEQWQRRHHAGGGQRGLVLAHAGRSGGALSGSARMQQLGHEPHGRGNAGGGVRSGLAGRSGRRPDPRERPLPAGSGCRSGPFPARLRARGGARPYRERHLPGRGRSPARSHVRGEHRHLRQQRGESSALLSGLSHERPDPQQPALARQPGRRAGRSLLVGGGRPARPRRRRPRRPATSPCCRRRPRRTSSVVQRGWRGVVARGDRPDLSPAYRPAH